MVDIEIKRDRVVLRYKGKKWDWILEPMALTDLSCVLEIERASFPTPWSEAAFRHELLDNPYSQLFVMKGTRVPGVIAPNCTCTIQLGRRKTGDSK